MTQVGVAVQWAVVPTRIQVGGLPMQAAASAVHHTLGSLFHATSPFFKLVIINVLAFDIKA